jgi:Isocitrate/isopropylmalate dehydrogenase
MRRARLAGRPRKQQRRLAARAGSYNICTLPGDGIGPEIMAVAKQCLHQAAAKEGVQFSFDERLIGGAAIDGVGSPYPEETQAACKASDAVLLAAIGGCAAACQQAAHAYVGWRAAYCQGPARSEQGGRGSGGSRRAGEQGWLMSGVRGGEVGRDGKPQMRCGRPECAQVRKFVGGLEGAEPWGHARRAPQTHHTRLQVQVGHAPGRLEAGERAAQPAREPQCVRQPPALPRPAAARGGLDAQGGRRLGRRHHDCARARWRHLLRQAPGACSAVRCGAVQCAAALGRGRAHRQYTCHLHL